MGVFANLFKKEGSEAVGGILEGAGSFAKDMRSAITGDIDPDKKAELLAKTYEIESNTLLARAEIIKAEANGQSFLQRNWRPIVMLWFAVLISLVYFGKVPPNVTEATQIELMGLLKIGLGGYVIGQSAEVVADKWNKK